MRQRWLSVLLLLSAWTMIIAVLALYVSVKFIILLLPAAQVIWYTGVACAFYLAAHRDLENMFRALGFPSNRVPDFCVDLFSHGLVLLLSGYLVRLFLMRMVA